MVDSIVLNYQLIDHKFQSDIKMRLFLITWLVHLIHSPDDAST